MLSPLLSPFLSPTSVALFTDIYYAFAGGFRATKTTPKSSSTSSGTPRPQSQASDKVPKSRDTGGYIGLLGDLYASLEDSISTATRRKIINHVQVWRCGVGGREEDGVAGQGSGRGGSRTLPPSFLDDTMHMCVCTLRS